MFSPIVSANIVPTSTGVSDAVSGLYTFSYAARLDDQQNLISGNELCFANIPGLAGISTAPSGWTATNGTGGCPISAGTNIPNVGLFLLETYDGPTIFGGADLGTFTFQSTDGGLGTANIPFGARAQKSSNLSVAANQGEVDGPLGVTATPEPAYFVFLGLALTILCGTKYFGALSSAQKSERFRSRCDLGTGVRIG